MEFTYVRTDRVKVLDHGYVQCIETWGSDEHIIEAARMSTGKGFKGWGVEETCSCCKGSGTNEPENGPGSLCKQCRGKKVFINNPGDEKLLAYLYNNKHMTPFEMGGMTIEVQAPIFVFREWHRHRTQSYNEMSARYEPLPDVNYVPTVERLMINSKTNKQAGVVAGAAELTVEAAEGYRRTLTRMYADDQAFYETALAMGVPKELARAHLPVGRYSRMRASANLRNWLAFLTLRMDPAAQWEIRQFANAVHMMVAESFPRTAQLFGGGGR